MSFEPGFAAEAGQVAGLEAEALEGLAEAEGVEEAFEDALEGDLSGVDTCHEDFLLSPGV